MLSIKSQGPEIIYEINGEFKNSFVEAGPERRKIILLSLANCIIGFCHKLSPAYDYKNNLVSEEIKNNYYSFKKNIIINKKCLNKSNNNKELLKINNND